jgi:hypothetical protein
MKTYAYRALFEPSDRRGAIVVNFPDGPEAVTQGRRDAVIRMLAPWPSLCRLSLKQRHEIPADLRIAANCW